MFRQNDANARLQRSSHESHQTQNGTGQKFSSDTIAKGKLQVGGKMIGLPVVSLIILLQPAASAERFKTLETKTNIILRAIARTEGPPPVKRNGAVYGQWRINIDTDTMTDDEDVEIETRGIGSPRVSLAAFCDGEGKFALVYRTNIAMFDADGSAQYHLRVDQNRSVSWMGNLTRDRKSTVMNIGSYEALMADPNDKEADLQIFVQMAGGDRIRVRASPDVSSNVENIFSLSGFAKASGVLGCV